MPYKILSLFQTSACLVVSMFCLWIWLCTTSIMFFLSHCTLKELYFFSHTRSPISWSLLGLTKSTWPDVTQLERKIFAVDRWRHLLTSQESSSHCILLYHDYIKRSNVLPMLNNFYNNDGEMSIWWYRMHSDIDVLLLYLN